MFRLVFDTGQLSGDASQMLGFALVVVLIFSLIFKQYLNAAKLRGQMLPDGPVSTFIVILGCAFALLWLERFI